MKFSKVKNKYLLKPVFTPKDFVERYYPGFRSPETIISVFNRNFFQQALSYIKAQKTKYKDFYKISDKLGINLSPFGAASFSSRLEDLFACGANTSIVFGFAAGMSEKLSPGDFIICTGALIDEGVSAHYCSRKKIFSRPCMKLNSRLKKVFTREKINYKCGLSWTTDAPYMETFEEVEQYSKNGIITVEMEASVSFSISSVRGKSAAAVFLISDLLLGDKKGFYFHHAILKENFHKGIKILLREFS